MAKVVFLGLDGFHPDFVKKWAGELPHLRRMQERGIWGSMKTLVPPTFPQVWTSTQCGQDPGVHGVWDFTFRDDFSYGEKKETNSEVINNATPLYTLLSRKAQKVAITNVPFTWPPPKIPGGYAISGPTASKQGSIFTYPDNLKEEIDRLVGDYIMDATEVNTVYEPDKEHILKSICDMDSQRFILTEHFINNKNCDFVMTSVRGADHMLNLFYQDFDSKVEHFDSDFSYEETLHDYYSWIDKKVGELCENFNKDVVLFICSCFGAQKLEGRINLNEWLIKEGYMVLFEYPKEPTPLKEIKVDWSNTKCWSSGYAGKLYLNVEGREPEGIVDPQDYDELLDELIARIQQDIPNGLGKKMHNQTCKRADTYFGPSAKYSPDLFLSFDEARLGTSELVGHNQKAILSHDIAPYNSNTAHSLYGYFVISGSGIPAEGEYEGGSILNIAPTVLDVFGLSIPKRMKKPSILSLVKKEGVKKAKETKKVRSRLERLGY